MSGAAARTGKVLKKEQENYRKKNDVLIEAQSKHTSKTNSGSNCKGYRIMDKYKEQMKQYVFIKKH